MSASPPCNRTIAPFGTSLLFLSLSHSLSLFCLNISIGTTWVWLPLQYAGLQKICFLNWNIYLQIPYIINISTANLHHFNLLHIYVSLNLRQIYRSPLHKHKIIAGVIWGIMVMTSVHRVQTHNPEVEFNKYIQIIFSVYIAILYLLVKVLFWNYKLLICPNLENLINYLEENYNVKTLDMCYLNPYQCFNYWDHVRSRL